LLICSAMGEEAAAETILAAMKASAASILER
jgi:hypothetical protein